VNTQSPTTAPTEKSLKGAAWLAAGPLPQLLDVLNADGEEARAIGGAVRDALIGKEPVEIDVATTAPPPDVIRRVERAGFKAVPTGIDHGTITVVIAGRPFEVTTLRQDVETFGRKATVRFGRDWRADAERRDFTMNALSVSPDGTVHDYVGGLADLEARRVRFIGEAATRIAEDYLRILRFFRFHAAYGEGPPDPAGLHAAIVAREGLEKLSRERIRMELIKLLQAPHAVATLEVMAEAGILGPVLGAVPLIASLANMTRLEEALKLGRDPMRALAALAVQIVEDAERLWQRLRLSNAEHEQLQAMGDRWWRITAMMDARAARVLLYHLGREHYIDRVLLAWARSGAAPIDAEWRQLATLPTRWKAPRFPLKAADLIKRGLERGPDLGRALKAAELAWIGADFPRDPAILAAIADDAVATLAS
jgi:poly(A) polymerase